MRVAARPLDRPYDGIDPASALPRNELPRSEKHSRLDAPGISPGESLRCLDPRDRAQSNVLSPDTSGTLFPS